MHSKNLQGLWKNQGQGKAFKGFVSDLKKDRNLIDMIAQFYIC